GAVAGAPQMAGAECRERTLQTVGLLAGQPQLLTRLLEPFARGCVRPGRGLEPLARALEVRLGVSALLREAPELLLDRRQTRFAAAPARQAGQGRLEPNHLDFESRALLADAGQSLAHHGQAALADPRLLAKSLGARPQLGQAFFEQRELIVNTA